MCKQDDKILQVKVMKNHLETYVYKNREHLDTYGDRKQYMEENQRSAFLEKLHETEAWIYGDGAQGTKEQYEEKLKELEVTGEPFDRRYRFHDIFPSKAAQMEEVLTNAFENAVQIPDDSHITEEEKSELLALIETTSKWFNETKTLQASLPHHEEPLFDLNEIESKKTDVTTLFNKVINKPKPKPKVEKKDEKKEGDAEMAEEAPKADVPEDKGGDVPMEDDLD